MEYMGTGAFSMLLAAFMTLSFELKNDPNTSYAINSNSCSLSCNETRYDGHITVNCTNAGCEDVPNGLSSDTTELIVVKNKIQKVYRDSFISLTNIIYLDLSHGKIRIIENGSFDPLQRLEFLNLSYNSGIKRFPERIFSRLSNLKELNLRTTQSSCTFDQSPFVNLEKLEIFIFDLNQLVKFPRFQTADEKEPLFPKLKYLGLRMNSIKKITRHALHGLEKSLETLNLNGNQIHHITGGTFAKMIRLKRLQLDRNRFGIIECNAFHSKTLESLSIAFSQFRQVSGKKCHNNILRHVPNLKTLILTRSIGFRLVTRPLSSQKHLRELSLIGTSINEYYLREVTRALPKLRILSLHDNHISSFDASFWNNVTLTAVSLSKNAITTINATSFSQKMWNSLKIVDFAQNPFYCDCNLVWFRVWLRKTNATVMNLNRTICSGPPERKGQIVAYSIRPTPLECFRADHDWFLLFTFLLCLTIAFAACFIAFLHKFRWYLKYWYFKTRTRARRLLEVLDETEYEFDAFVIFSETDNVWVRDTLCRMLEKRFNFRLCVHYRDWMIGCDIVTNIVDSIEKSRKTLMIVSNAFAESQWCHFEMMMAQTKLFEEDRDHLILVLLEEIFDCNINPRLQLQMQKKTYVEWTENPVGQQLFWEKLRQVLSIGSTSIVNSTPPRELFISLEEI